MALPSVVAGTRTLERTGMLNIDSRRGRSLTETIWDDLNWGLSEVPAPGTRGASLALYLLTTSCPSPNTADGMPLQSYYSERFIGDTGVTLPSYEANSDGNKVSPIKRSH